MSNQNRYKDIVREHIRDELLNGDDRGLDYDTDLQELGVLDSFSTLGLASFVADTFSVVVDPIDINTETFRSIDSIVALVANKQAA